MKYIFFAYNVQSMYNGPSSYYLLYLLICPNLNKKFPVNTLVYIRLGNVMILNVVRLVKRFLLGKVMLLGCIELYEKLILSDNNF